MVQKSVIFVLIYLFYLIGHFQNRRNFRYNSKCRTNVNSGRGTGDSIGTCRRFSQCNTAQYLVNYYRLQPSVCFNDQFGPVVCCPRQLSASNGNQNNRPNSNNSNNKNNNSRNIRKPRISEQSK